LKKYKFVDEQLRYVNKEGRLIDVDGRLVDDQGRYIDKSGNFVDKYGNKVDSEGEYVAEFEPFLDDDGKPVVVDEETTEEPKPKAKIAKKPRKAKAE